MVSDLIFQLRKELHACPEISGQEVRTKALLKEFLKKYTTLEIHDCGEGFYAAHREKESGQTGISTAESAGGFQKAGEVRRKSNTMPGIALRADYDALAMPDGSAAHLCGHDGHAAALCGAALAAEGRTFGRDIFFLFQPAEETGAGAEGCTELFEKENISEIYGAHNLPGFAFGKVFTRPHTFACASRGVILDFQGKPTHAAYPENGISPAGAMGELLCKLPALSDPARYTGMTLCTVIGMNMGEKAFGAAAAGAQVWLTLRAEHDVDLEMLHKDILHLSSQLADEHCLEFSHQVQDIFPATENTPACAQKVLDCCHGSLLETPMRWSEDFGHYLQKCPGAFFGIGAGEDYPPLHTENYEYPDGLLEPTIETFMALLEY